MFFIRPTATSLAFSALLGTSLLTGCPTGTDEPTPEADPQPDVDPGEAPETYTFDSRFDDGTSISYSGQVNRHALIRGLKSYIGGIDDDTFTAGTSADDVKAALRYFTDYKNQGGDGSDDVPYSLTDASGNDVDTVQLTFGDIGSPASLEEKLPDVDADFGTAGWSDGYGVIGYGDGTQTPSAVLDAMLTELATLVAARADGTYETDPAGADLEVAFLSGNGVDHQQLIQKFLDGAVTYSQAADDYLDDDVDGKGLLSDNTVAVEKDGSTKSYTALEHVWDEGFGYFGAARDYDAYTDDEIAAKGGRDAYAGGFFDSDDDGAIDLKSEINQGHSVNAAKRDRGTSGAGATDYTQQAFDAFVAGRHLIATGEDLDADELAELTQHRDDAMDAWERAIAATVVHYINDVLRDMGTFGTDEYSFADHAKHWSEAKGFALSLQFNPRAALSRAQLTELHDHLGDAPVLPSADAADIEAYAADLNAAKTLLKDAYDFHVDNMGDEAGQNGW